MFQASFLVSVIFSTAVHAAELSFSLSTQLLFACALCCMEESRLCSVVYF